MRILRFAGVFTVALRQGECGRKTSEMHVSQQVCIGVCCTKTRKRGPALISLLSDI